jgi:hypothetical protein
LKLGTCVVGWHGTGRCCVDHRAGARTLHLHGGMNPAAWSSVLMLVLPACRTMKHEGVQCRTLAASGKLRFQLHSCMRVLAVACRRSSTGAACSARSASRRHVVGVRVSRQPGAGGFRRGRARPASRGQEGRSKLQKPKPPPAFIHMGMQAGVVPEVACQLLVIFVAVCFLHAPVRAGPKAASVVNPRLVFGSSTRAPCTHIHYRTQELCRRPRAVGSGAEGRRSRLTRRQPSA